MDETDSHDALRVHLDVEGEIAEHRGNRDEEKERPGGRGNHGEQPFCPYPAMRTKERETGPRGLPCPANRAGEGAAQTCTGRGFPRFVPDHQADEERDRGVDDDVPRVDGRHRPEREPAYEDEERAAPDVQVSEPEQRVDEQEDKEDLVEHPDDVGVDVPPQEGEQGVLVDGVRDRPGAVPQDRPDGLSLDDLPDKGGVDGEERPGDHPGEPRCYHFSQGVENNCREPEDRGEHEVERDLRRHTARNPECAEHPVPEVIVDIEVTGREPGVQRRDDRQAHHGREERMVHELLRVRDAGVREPDAQHREEEEEEYGCIDPLRRPVLLCIFLPVCSEEKHRRERDECEGYGEPEEPAVPAGEGEQEERDGERDGVGVLGERAPQERPDRDLEEGDEEEPGDNREGLERIVNQPSSPRTCPGTHS